VDREEWNRRYATSELVWTAAPNRFLVAEVADLEPGRALDLGSGEGRNAVWLAEQGWRVTAVDFSDVGMEKAAGLAAARGVEVEWVLADVLEYEPEPAAFDLVCLLYLQLPVSERRVSLAKAAGAVAPGGTVLVVGHDLENLTKGWSGPTDPDVLFTPDGVAADLAPLEIEKAERVVREIEPGGHTAIDTLVRARRSPTAPDEFRSRRRCGPAASLRGPCD
jgi:SAM-dependent methyltransferase